MVSPLSLNRPMIWTRLSGLRTAGGRRYKASTMLNTAELTPTPTASESTATTVTAGRRQSERMLIRMDESTQAWEHVRFQSYSSEINGGIRLSVRIRTAR